MGGRYQPPSGGCVLKQSSIGNHLLAFRQPPSGGCVLKLYTFHFLNIIFIQPPSGGCVLKHFYPLWQQRFLLPSRLQAAVC